MQNQRALSSDRHNQEAPPQTIGIRKKKPSESHGRSFCAHIRFQRYDYRDIPLP